MFKKIFILLIFLSGVYADLLNISNQNTDVYTQVTGKWKVTYEVGDNKFNFDINISTPYFNERVDGFVVDIYENEENIYICSYNLAFKLEEFKRYSEFICLKKNNYEQNHRIKSFVTFSINENENTLIGRMGVLVESIEAYSYPIVGIKLEVITKKEDLKLKLKKGWNLISIPINAKLITMMEDVPALDSDPTYTFNDFGKYEEIWIYSNDKWIKNPTSILKAQGFWIKSNENQKTIFFRGDRYFPDLIGLSSGWHLMGTGSTIIDAMSISTTEYKIEVIWKYNDIWIKNPDTIEAGEGFWIKKIINY